MIHNIFMKKLKFQLIIVITLFTFLWNSIAAVAFNQNSEIKISLKNNDDYYFVHLTDTHIRHRLFDIYGTTKERLTTVIEHAVSFENKPAFIVITGDLTEWAGSGISGALNSIAFASCFNENDNQLFADANFTIPVYTTPGNHDYCYNRNLKNYHRFIDKNHIGVKDRYNITYGDITLFFMDSGPNYYLNPLTWTDICGDGLYDCDINWLEDELSSCTSAKKIVLMHHPAINRRKNGRMGGVIIRNREEFIELCNTNNVDIVLAGHTHNSRVYDSDEVLYDGYPINSSQYSTLYVQSDDCKQSIHYRNISIQGDDIWIEESIELDIPSSEQTIITGVLEYIFMDIQKNIFYPSTIGERQS